MIHRTGFLGCILAAAVLLLLPALLGCGQSVRRTAAGSTLAERLGAKMRDFQSEFPVPAFQVGVLKDGQEVYTGAIGVRTLGRGEAITGRTLFHVASVSKPFTAAAVLQLVERGSLGLDDPVVDRLPYFRLKDPRYRHITIRQLLAHTSGLPDLGDYEWDKPQWDAGAAERFVRSLGNLELKTAPGERFGYSNIGYDILGDVVAKVSGMSFEAYMKDRVLMPLGMRDSTFLKSEVPADLGVSPHRKGIGTLFMQRVAAVYPYNRAHAPSSTLHSNAGELLRFCRAFLPGNTGPQVLSSASLGLAWTEQADQGLRDSEKAEWMGKAGLGWSLGHYKGHRMVSAVGADPGFRASVAILPERGIVVVCVGNSDGFRVGLLSRAMLDMALE